MLNPNDLSRLDTALFRLRYAGCNEAFPGADFKDGVTVAPVAARDALRLYQAFGPALIIEPWESGGTVASAPEPIKEPVLTKEESREELHKIAEGAGLTDDLDSLSRDALHDLASDLGLSPHWKAGADKLRKLIRRARRDD